MGDSLGRSMPATSWEGSLSRLGKWYDPVKGFGFIAVEGESKDLFVHVSVVERAGLGALEQGQAVRVSVVEGRKGREVGTIERI